MPKTDRLYQELLSKLRRQVKASYSEGEGLPSQRALADMHGVGLATVHRALKQLATEGLVETRRGSGVVRTGGKKAPRPRKKALRIGIIDLITCLQRLRIRYKLFS